MRKVKIIFFAIAVIATAVCCIPQQGMIGPHMAGPQTIIYKTRADYSKNVPVTLSDDKSKIVSYPAPQDVYRNGQLAYPTPLVKGYLLDNRGVSVNTAFLALTYDEYAKLGQMPNPDDLYNQIIDKNPFTQMYNLGTRYSFKDLVPQIDSIIDHHKLKDFKRLK